MSRPTVGFIGVGSMGWPMAANLARAGFPVLAADADMQRARQFAEQHGARGAAADAEMARACQVVVTMLPTSAIVGRVLLAPAFLDNLQPGTLVIEMSSGVPEETVRIARQLADKGIALVDAPVSGGVKRAETGELAIMVGGAPEDVERARSVLSAMGNNLMPTGSVGSGHAMKALNNMVSAAGFVAGIEALLIGKQFGLDPAVMVDVLNASTGMNNSTQKKFKQFVLSGAYNSGFGLDLMLKDIDIAMQLARGGHVAAPVASSCHQVWEAARNLLGCGLDHTEVARLSERLAGVTLEAQ